MRFSETAVYFKERFSIPWTLDEIKNCWTQMSIGKYRYEVPLKDGVKEFLSYCKENGIRTGIATSNGRDMVDAVVDSLKIGQYLDVITTACEVKAGKPEPDIYLEVANRLHVDPADCIVFEDIPAGIIAGKRAGMTVIAVEDDFSKWMKEEKVRLSDGFINSYVELREELI